MQLHHFEAIDTALSALLRAEGTPAEARMESRLFGALIGTFGYAAVSEIPVLKTYAVEIVTAGLTGKLELEDVL
jgi:hypothetical protein